MRFPLAAIALATLVVGSGSLCPLMAEDEAGPKDPPLDPDWKSLLATDQLPPGDRQQLARLAPFLDPAIYRSLTKPEQDALLRYTRARFDPASRVARCWAPNTPVEILTAYHAAEEAARAGAPEDESDTAPRKANQFLRRWSTTATNGGGQGSQGRPITLTWSVVPDGTPIPGDPTIGDASAPSNLRAFLAGIYPGSDTGPPENQPWFQILQATFDRISSQCGINYVYEPTDDGSELGSASGSLGNRGDIRIGGHDIDGNGSTLAYNFFPNDGDMVLDTGDNWFNLTSGNSLRLTNTFEHEHGHGLGLEHVCPVDNTKLMEPIINTAFRGIRFDEIYTLQRHYGDSYEHHGGLRSNDSFAAAAPLPIVSGVSFAAEWVSIDDNNDIDHYSFEAGASATLAIRVLPSTLAYLEGEQNANGSCSSGAPFDPGDLHDLSLELIGPDQSTVLATATANPAGQHEEIIDFEVNQGGTHYIRVSGDSSDACQLYRLEVLATAPAVAIALAGDALLTESFSPPNGLIDPGETVELAVTLDNGGSLEAANLHAALTGPAGFTGFTTGRAYGSIPAGGSETRTFVFGLEGECADSIELDLTVTTGDGKFIKKIPLRFNLGLAIGNLVESFDGNGLTLPTDWSSSDSGFGSGWTVTAARANSAPSSAFASNLPGVGQSLLVSPASILGSTGGTLTFQHLYSTEAGFDGAVLEIAVNGGPWQDILAAGGSFTAGGYNDTISTSYNSPISGRSAWSGNSTGFVACSVLLPPALGDQELQFRWLMAHDSSIGGLGWYVDDVSLTFEACDPTLPLVSLALLDGSASEFAPLDRARLGFSTLLPTVAELAVPLVNSGTADPLADATGLDPIVIPAGQSSVEATVQAVNDAEVEGPESLILSIDPGASLVAAGEPEVTITLSDTPYGSWAASTFGLGTANHPLDDFDLDHSLNIEEYAWQTGATSATSHPRLNPRLSGPFFRIDAPLASLPTDLLLRAEASPDLLQWSPTEIQPLPAGFQIPRDDPRRFLRLVYELLPAAP